ncbi:MAG: hypothetical protein ACYCPW_08105 [Nitrososphaerales archaeon]
MKTLNSVHSRGMAAKIGGMGVLAIAAILLLSFAPFFSFAATPTVTVQPSAASYPATVGTQIPISGVVTPAPGAAGYSVTVEVTNPSGLFTVQSASVDPTTGAYSTTFVSGTPGQLWGNGTYTVTAVYATSANGPTYTATNTFTYGTFTTTTTSNTGTGSTSNTGGTTTTIITTIISATTVTQVTTVNVGTTVIGSGATVINSGTIVNSGTTTIVSGSGTTVTSLINSGTTTTVNNGGSNGTALAIGAVGLVVAIIAGALAAMALRKH